MPIQSPSDGRSHTEETAWTLALMASPRLTPALPGLPAPLRLSRKGRVIDVQRREELTRLWLFPALQQQPCPGLLLQLRPKAPQPHR
eukprot:49440-Eustigmatos_ZCMA.PRE.1